MTCRTILIVEDDHDVRVTLQEVLEMEGYPVLTAANGQEAIEALQRSPRPCLILLDLMMPIMNGWEFLDVQKQDVILATIPVIIVSAAGEKAKSASAQGFIKKPVEIESLLHTVQTYCSATPH